MNLAENILQNLPCGCIVFESAGKITYANPEICNILDFKADDLIGSNIEKILTISSRIFYQTHLFPILKLQGQANEIFLNLKSSSGNTIPVMVNVKSGQENGLIFYIATLATVWERQKYEQELISAKRAQEKANQENEQMLRLTRELELNQQQLDSNLSQLMRRSDEYLQIGKVLTHDMHEPIRKIALFFRALLDEDRIKQDREDLRKIDVINRSIARLRNLTNALFDFVSLTSTMEKNVLLSVPDLIREAEKKVKHSLAFADFTVQIATLPNFSGKPTQITRVFVELLKNAVQNRDVTRPLVVKIKAVQTKNNSYQVNTEKYNYVDHVKIEFIDNGIGFESEFESHVFDLSNKLNKNSDGIGLGLTLCRQIISQHYGSIKATSRLGEGTNVTMMIPVTSITSHAHKAV